MCHDVKIESGYDNFKIKVRHFVTNTIGGYRGGGGRSSYRDGGRGGSRGGFSRQDDRGFSGGRGGRGGMRGGRGGFRDEPSRFRDEPRGPPRDRSRDTRDSFGGGYSGTLRFLYFV